MMEENAEKKFHYFFKASMLGESVKMLRCPDAVGFVYLTSIIIQISIPGQTYISISEL